MSDRRYHAIDKLRTAMMSTVMFGHALLPYLTVPRHFQDPKANLAFDVTAIFLYSFAMQVFFVTAGFSAAALLERRGVAGLFRNRWQRIFLPFLAAYLLLSPLTRAANRFAREVTQTLSIQSGIDALVNGHWLRWNKLYHLWFLPALLVFTFLAVAAYLAARRLPPHFSARLVAASRRALASRWRAAILALIIAPAMLAAYFLANGNERTSLMGLVFFAFFALGWLLYRQRGLLPTFRSQAGWLIGIAVVALPVTVWASRLRLMGGGDPDVFVGLVGGIGNTVLAACMSFGLLGLFQARLDQPSARWRYFGDASYWIYLIHYPLLIFAGAALQVTSFPAGIKYLLTLAIVIPLVMGSYHFGVQRTAFGRVLVGRSRA